MFLRARFAGQHRVASGVAAVIAMVTIGNGITADLAKLGNISCSCGPASSAQAAPVPTSSRSTSATSRR